MGKRKRKSILPRAVFIEALERRLLLTTTIDATAGQNYDVVDIDGTGGAQGTGDVYIPAGASVSADQIRQNTLTVNGTLTLNAAAAGAFDASHVSVVNNLSLGFDPGTGQFTGTLDLNNDVLIIHATAENRVQIFNEVWQALQSGFDEGAWDGTGIRSTMAANDPTGDTSLGVMINDTNGQVAPSNDGGDFPIYTVFAGQPVSQNDIIVAYTLYGDADLNGSVNLDDFADWEYGFFDPSVDPIWQNGNFLYEGGVSLDDFGLWLSLFQANAQLPISDLPQQPTTPPQYLGGVTDPNPSDPPSAFTAVTDWGDSTTPTLDGIVSDEQGNYYAFGDHTYNQTGTFTTNTTFTGPGPSVLDPAAADVSSDGLSAVLSVLGSDFSGETPLSYNWTEVSGPSGVTFDTTNGGQSSYSITAELPAAGTYNFQADITNPSSQSVTSDVTFTVGQTFTSIEVSPADPMVAPDGTQQFAAQALDQFGDPMTMQPGFSWNIASGGGSVDSNGNFTGSSTDGTVEIEASSDNVEGNASADVDTSQPYIPTIGATGVSSSAINLTFTQPTDGSSLELEEQGPGDANFHTIGIPGALSGQANTYQLSGLGADSEFQFRLRALLNGVVTYSSPTTAMTFPTGVTNSNYVLQGVTFAADPVTDGFIDITWRNSPTQANFGYVESEAQFAVGNGLYLYANPDTYWTPGQLGNGGTVTAVDQLAPGTHYRVRLDYDSATTGAEYSPWVNVTTNGAQVIPAASGLTVSGDGSGGYQFNWTWNNGGNSNLVQADMIFEIYGYGVTPNSSVLQGLAVGYYSVGQLSLDVNPVDTDTLAWTVLAEQPYQQPQYFIPSNVVIAGSTSQPQPPPAAPANAGAVLNTRELPVSVNLYWDNTPNDETGFVIYRSVNGGAFSQIGNVGADVTSYVDSNPPPGATCTYEIGSVIGGGTPQFSTPTNAVSIPGVSVRLTPYRTDGNFGVPIPDSMVRAGNPNDYVVPVNDNFDQQLPDTAEDDSADTAPIQDDQMESNSEL